MPCITLNIIDVTPVRSLVLATMLSFKTSTPVTAQCARKGYDAFNAGDYATALKEWLPLAERGSAEAQYGLKVMCYEGRGTLQNFSETFKWFRLAAEQGYTQGQTYLGIVYQTGKVVPQDYASVVKLWRLAAANGDDRAGKNWDKIAKKMSPAAIEKARAMTGECMNSGYTKCGD